MVGEWGWVSGNFLQILRKFLGNLPEISRNRGGVRGLQSDIAQRQNKILMYGLHQNDPTVMPESPVEYLRKCNLTLIYRFFPTPLK